MPTGWKDCALADACSAIDYGLTASASEEADGPKFLRIADIVGGIPNWSAVPHVVAEVSSTKCVNGQAVYPLSEQDGLKARERRYTAHEEGKHWE